ncbi:MAG: type II secretion system protein [Limisphaerales bacterium]
MKNTRKAGFTLVEIMIVVASSAPGGHRDSELRESPSDRPIQRLPQQPPHH